MQLPLSFPSVTHQIFLFLRINLNIDNQYLNIGINWQASPNPDLDKGRSFKLKYFNEISIVDKIKLHSLQKIYGLDQINEISKQFQLNIIDNFDEVKKDIKRMVN